MKLLLRSHSLFLHIIYCTSTAGPSGRKGDRVAAAQAYNSPEGESSQPLVRERREMKLVISRPLPYDDHVNF